MTSPRHPLSHLTPTIREIERSLAGFYGFDILSPAEAHVMSREEVSRSLGPAATGKPEYLAQGSVWLYATDDREDVFLGIHFSQAVADTIGSLDPLARLNDSNLGAYCVLVEEISHFHLILNRAAKGLSVTKTELEWQGEVDKLVMAGLTLDRQCGDPHLLPLARKLYDLADITAEDESSYREATRYAARYWFEALTRLAHPLEARPELREKYRASWRDKKTALTVPGLRKAS